MTNIWSFLVQTSAVTVTALFIWGVKTLIVRQLPPKWQYGLWSVLALRMLIPVHTGRYFFLPSGLWIESLKGMVEQKLSSAYAVPYIVAEINHVFPKITSVPKSITDWLFIFYVIGVIAYLMYAGYDYLRLRRWIRSCGTEAEIELQDRLKMLAARYDLPVCKVCRAEGIHSPFICGIRDPVLVLPMKDVDDKVLLHELLHLRHYDIWQNLLWYVMRALHWCNPVLRLVFDQINNDLEMVCDHRVLMLLEGEERRDYGRILLSMANDMYASVPGTSSIANGGRNIRQRIGAIVYFKKFPRGMVVLGISLLFLLGAPALYGTAYTVDADALEPKTDVQMERAIALVRIRRCTTAAGAIDTYAKGLMLQNGLYRMMAASETEMDGLLQQTAYVTGQENRYPYWLESGGPFGQYPNMQNYQVCNLTEQADGSYTALLAFDLSADVYALAEDALRADDNVYKAYRCCFFLPVRVWEENGWVAAQNGEIITVEGSGIGQNNACNQAISHVEGLPYAGLYRWEGEVGIVEIELRTVHTVDNAASGDFMQQSLSPTWSTAPKPDGEFSQGGYMTRTQYIPAASCEAKETVGIIVRRGDRIEPFSAALTPSASYCKQGDGEGCSMALQYLPFYDGALICPSTIVHWYEEGKDTPPETFRICVYWDAKPVQEMVLTEVK